MDHTQGGSVEEACSSSESRWTDYLLSSENTTDDDDMVDYINGDGHRGNDKQSNCKGSDSDDSSASDASSRPGHLIRRPEKSSKTSRYVKAEEKMEGEQKSGFNCQGSRDSSVGSSKTNFQRVEKEKAVDKKAASDCEGASTAAFYEL